MRPTLLPLPAFSDNYIWTLRCGHEALVVDPGDAAVVEAWLNHEGLTLTHILVTHHHPDHTAGLLHLKARHQAVIFGPDENIAGLDHVVTGGEQLDLGVFGHAQVLAVPGHTLGHIAWHLPKDDLLFCGDTLFSAGCGRLFEGTAAQLHASLQALSALPDASLVCCTHEYTTANLRFALAVEPDNAALVQRQQEVADLRAKEQPSLPVRLEAERGYNPFLRTDIPAVIAAASQHAGRPLTPGQETLAALRRWKDVF
ncbi:MAG: hydroxyacylglutathione hydrolase [Moraxellaceae bacterium]|nr:hydroxyacylglutathione hydrolase [Moraxellaceae bacterium]